MVVYLMLLVWLVPLSAVARQDALGWLGETYDPLKVWGHYPLNSRRVPEIENVEETKDPVLAMSHTEEREEEITIPKGQPWIEQLSWQPRAFLYHSLLTDEECNHIITTARPFVGLPIPQDCRSPFCAGPALEYLYRRNCSFCLNNEALFSRGLDEVIYGIEKKVADWVHIPVTHQESMNVLRYGFDQKYGEHIDPLTDEESPRVATVLLYLSDVPEGGETAFTQTTQSHWIDEGTAERMGVMSDCADGHVATKPKKGDALLFFSVTPDGRIDPYSTHMGCEVKRGVKWTSTVWIHSTPFDDFELDSPPKRLGTDPGICANKDNECPDWEREGFCETKETSMAYWCRLSCNFCTECEDGDHECYTNNRLRAGYPRIEDVY